MLNTTVIIKDSSIRRDILSMVYLVRFVVARRRALLAAGEETQPVDELLDTLRQELRVLWRSRSCACTLGGYHWDPDFRRHLDPEALIVK